jgi:urease accessory protein
LLIGVFCLAAGAAIAHPGHHQTSAGFAAGWAHPLSGFDHLLAMVMVGLLGWRMESPSDRLRVPALFVASMALGSAAGFAGGAIAWAESAVAASVVMLGGTIALATRVGRGSAWTLVIAAGAIHGYVHGLEAPSSAGGYLPGVLLSTAALHAAGYFAGLALTRAGRPALIRVAACAMTGCFVIARW